jgi:hypothetical protein
VQLLTRGLARSRRGLDRRFSDFSPRSPSIISAPDMLPFVIYTHHTLSLYGRKLNFYIRTRLISIGYESRGFVLNISIDFVGSDNRLAKILRCLRKPRVPITSTVWTTRSVSTSPKATINVPIISMVANSTFHEYCYCFALFLRSCFAQLQMWLIYLSTGTPMPRPNESFYHTTTSSNDKNTCSRELLTSEIKNHAKWSTTHGLIFIYISK